MAIRCLLHSFTGTVIWPWSLDVSGEALSLASSTCDFRTWQPYSQHNAHGLLRARCDMLRQRVSGVY